MLHLRGRPARGACCHASGRVCFPMMSPVAIAVLSVSMSADAFAAAMDESETLRSALARFTPRDFLALMQKHQIPFHEKHKTDRRFNRMRPSIAPRKRHQAG